MKLDKKRIADFKVGDKIHVLKLNKASDKFKKMYEDTYGEVIEVLSPSIVEQMTSGGFVKVDRGISSNGLLVKLTPNEVSSMNSKFGGFSSFRKGEFVLTDNDDFIGI